MDIHPFLQHLGRHVFVLFNEPLDYCEFRVVAHACFLEVAHMF